MDDLKETVIKLLESNKFKRNSKSWTDYEYAKICLDKNLPPIDSIQWHDACVIVAEYLGV
jgi:hypothetical protein